MSTLHKQFIKFDDTLAKVEGSVLITLVVVMTVVVFLQVFFRYVIVQPLYWSEELARYLFVWLSILGAALGLQKGGHFGVDTFFKMLSEKGRHFVGLLINLLIGALALVILIHGITLVEKTATQNSPAMQISMSWAYASLPVGAALMLIHIVAILLKQGSKKQGKDMTSMG